MNPNGDEELIRDVAGGREESLAILVRRHRRGLLGWFERRLSSREDAEEAELSIGISPQAVSRTGDPVVQLDLVHPVRLGSVLELLGTFYGLSHRVEGGAVLIE